MRLTTTRHIRLGRFAERLSPLPRCIAAGVSSEINGREIDITDADDEKESR